VVAEPCEQLDPDEMTGCASDGECADGSACVVPESGGCFPSHCGGGVCTRDCRPGYCATRCDGDGGSTAPGDDGGSVGSSDGGFDPWGDGGFDADDAGVDLDPYADGGLDVGDAGVDLDPYADGGLDCVARDGPCTDGGGPSMDGGAGVDAGPPADGGSDCGPPDYDDLRGCAVDGDCPSGSSCAIDEDGAGCYPSHCSGGWCTRDCRPGYCSACGGTDGGTPHDGGFGFDGGPSFDAGAGPDAGAPDGGSDDPDAGEPDPDDPCADEDGDGEVDDLEACLDDHPYVTIGVIPSPYPISWANPFQTLVTTARAGITTWDHPIGHVLLEYDCGGEGGVRYISQSGLNEWDEFAVSVLDAYQAGPSTLFETWSGELQTQAVASADWSSHERAQIPFGRRPLPGPGLNATYDTAMRYIIPSVHRFMPRAPVPRHRFVQATILLSEAQCNAITGWENAYVADGGPGRYGVHSSPWARWGPGQADGGGCASVGWTGAFYATGLDYRAAAPSSTVRLAIGSSRLVREIDWSEVGFNMHDAGRFARRVDQECTPSPEWHRIGCRAEREDWVVGGRPNPYWLLWSGAPDAPTITVGVWGGAARRMDRTVPLRFFDPERMYAEIMAGVGGARNNLFGHAGWLRVPGQPHVLLDARTLNRPGINRNGRSTLTQGWSRSWIW